MKNKKIILLLAIVGIITFVACSKNNPSSDEVPADQQNLTMNLTDAPGLFYQVNLDIKSVKVLVDPGNTSWGWDQQGYLQDSARCIWQNLVVKPGIYDVLKLTNGKDTLLATGNVKKGKVRLIAIELGTNNTIVKDSGTTAQQLYLYGLKNNTIYLRLRGDVSDTTSEFAEDIIGSRRFKMWVDFDVQKSIVQVPSGPFQGLFVLIPNLRTFVLKNGGILTGRVSTGRYSVIRINNNVNDTGYTMPNREGYFKVFGLGLKPNANPFTVKVTGYRLNLQTQSIESKDTVITGVVITPGQTKDLGNININFN